MLDRIELVAKLAEEFDLTPRMANEILEYLGAAIEIGDNGIAPWSSEVGAGFI